MRHRQRHIVQGMDGAVSQFVDPRQMMRFDQMPLRYPVPAFPKLAMRMLILSTLIRRTSDRRFVKRPFSPVPSPR